MAPDLSDPALAAMVERVKAIVENTAGDARDDELLDIFRRLRRPSSSSTDSSLEALQTRIRSLPDAVAARAVPTASRLPGGALVHRAMAKATERRDQVLMEDIRTLAGEVRNRLLEISEFAPSGSTVDDRLVEEMEALLDTVSALEGEVSSVTARLEAVEEKLDRLTGSMGIVGYNPWFSSIEFDDEFRGGRPVILDRYHDVADLLAATGGPVVDLGCGRGELVELLATRSVEVWGVEMSEELVEYCRSIYLDVRLNDAASALNEVEDGSLGGAALIHVVEHVTAQHLTELVALMARKVRPGGQVVVETPNPTSPYIFSHSFYLDPTHTTPVHPSYLAFLFRKGGFSGVEVQLRSEVSDIDRIVPVEAGPEHAELAKQVNEALALLDRLLLGPQDYAVIATR